MKKITFTILLFTVFSVFSQHPDLQKRWFVQNITINNVTTEIPSDLVSFPFTQLIFFPVVRVV